MFDIQSFANKYSLLISKLIIKIDHYLTNELLLEARECYGAPFYYEKSRICYINPKKDYIDLVFMYGKYFSKEDKSMLDFNNRKLVGSIKIYKIEDIDYDYIKHLVIISKELIKLKS